MLKILVKINLLETEGKVMSKISETNRNIYGELYAISAYRNNKDIDVIFQKDNSIVNTTYEDFLSGLITSSKNLKSEWIGIDVTDASNEKCIITEFRDEDDITVSYPDGDMISGLSLLDAVNGAFSRNYEDSETESILYGRWNKEKNIAMERKKTYENVLFMLYRYRKCMLVRPCGFGKTQIGIKLFRSSSFRKCLFLHPSKDEMNRKKIEETCLSGKVDIMTYAKLRKMSDDEIQKMNYDLVFLDEVHCVGGDYDEQKGAHKTCLAIKKLMKWHKETCFLGATATPVRMDGIDVGKELFQNHYSYPYTDEDAVEDGIIKKPHYRYCIYDVIKKVRNEVSKDVNKTIKMNRETLEKTLKIHDDELEEIDARFMDKHIRSLCDKLLPDTKYMRFIAYYLTNEDINNNIDKVVNWFKKAYPKYQIGTLIVTSRSGQDLDAVDELPTSPTEDGYEGRIDIIFNCNMICMGYHSNLITGLIMDRKTQSLTRYFQMIGRLLSCDDDTPVIIFDIVDNLHSEFITGNKHVENIKLPEIPDLPELTFENVVRLNPKARHWERINSNNKKARKVESLVKKYVEIPKTACLKTEDTIINAEENIKEKNIEDDSINLPDSSILQEEKRKSAFEYIKAKNLSFTEAMEVLKDVGEITARNISKPEILVTPETPSTENSKKTTIDPKSAKPDIKDYKTQNNKNLKKSETQIKSEETENSREMTDSTLIRNRENDEYLGYDSGTFYYDYATGSLYGKNIYLENRNADYMEEKKKIVREILVNEIESAITYWQNRIGKENFRYSSYEEIDTKSPVYKMLKACCDVVCGVKAEVAVRYMIEGV